MKLVKELELKIESLEETIDTYREISGELINILSNETLSYSDYPIGTFKQMIERNFLNVNMINVYLDDITTHEMDLDEIKTYLLSVFNDTKLDIDSILLEKIKEMLGDKQ